MLLSFSHCAYYPSSYSSSASSCSVFHVSSLLDGDDDGDDDGDCDDEDDDDDENENDDDDDDETDVGGDDDCY